MANVQRIERVVAVLVFGAALASSAPPAFAASPITVAFLANVAPNVQFLERSSKIVLTASTSRATRNFARNEAAKETRIAAALPVRADRMGDADGLVTGRSVATDAPSGASANGRQPIGPSDLDHLASLSGRAFDDVYWEKQLDALSQLRADYIAYVAAGDDATLVAMAKRELPKVEQRLLALSKV